MSTLISPAEKAAALEASPLMLDYRGVARLLGLSVKTIERLGSKVPGRTKLGRRTLFVRSEVLRWVADGCPTGASPKAVIPSLA